MATTQTVIHTAKGIAIVIEDGQIGDRLCWFTQAAHPLTAEQVAAIASHIPHVNRVDDVKRLIRKARAGALHVRREGCEVNQGAFRATELAMIEAIYDRRVRY